MVSWQIIKCKSRQRGRVVEVVDSVDKSFSIEEAAGTVQVVRLLENLTGDQVFQFENCMKELVNAGHNKFVLEMKNVDYISSRGVGVVAYALGKCRKEGGDIKLVGLSAFVKKLFKIIKLDKIFEECKSVEEAIEGFNS